MVREVFLTVFLELRPWLHLGTDNVRGQISVHVLAPNEGYCLYIATEKKTILGLTNLITGKRKRTKKHFFA